MSNPKALLIHADGTVEELPPSEAVGCYIIREEKCPCGAVIRRRKFEGEYASNVNTVLDGNHREGAWGPANQGTIIFIEKPV